MDFCGFLGAILIMSVISHKRFTDDNTDKPAWEITPKPQNLDQLHRRGVVFRSLRLIYDHDPVTNALKGGIRILGSIYDPATGYEKFSELQVPWQFTALQMNDPGTKRGKSKIYAMMFLDTPSGILEIVRMFLKDWYRFNNFDPSTINFDDDTVVSKHFNFSTLTRNQSLEPTISAKRVRKY